jgi:hypothetical protein
MQKVIGLLAMLVLGLGCPSCSSIPTYTIKVNGYTDPGTPGQLRPGASFFVMENKEAKNVLLETEIKAKLHKLLVTQGYSVTTFEKADYCLFFGYGMGEPRSVTVAAPDSYGGFGWGVGYGRGGWGGWGGPSVYVGMPWGGVAADSATLYDRWLLLTVVEGPAYRTQKESRPVWVGEARSVGVSSDLRTVLNYLMVADFREFGKNTGKAVTLEINAENPEIAVLAR